MHVIHRRTIIKQTTEFQSRLKFLEAFLRSFFYARRQFDSCFRVNHQWEATPINVNSLACNQVYESLTLNAEAATDKVYTNRSCPSPFPDAILSSSCAVTQTISYTIVGPPPCSLNVEIREGQGHSKTTKGDKHMCGLLCRLAKL
jgi:hypothetical protein